MELEQAKRLRAPFPPAAIGKLPKAGMMLDYVGHAATTDRLLEVDPTWTWEPFAVDDAGLPRLDDDGNLWIRLTVCGVTRPGVGDGKTAKERIGDAIRNAAMRFGVALDLWAKEDLQANGEAPAVSVMERQKQRIQARQQEAKTATTFVAPDPKPDEISPEQYTLANLLVGQLRERTDSEGNPALTTFQVWTAIANKRSLDVEALIERLGGRDEDGVLHWSPLREKLTKDEISSLIDRLQRYEQSLGEDGA